MAGRSNNKQGERVTEEECQKFQIKGIDGLPDCGEGFVGSADEGGGFVEDDRDRNVGKNFGEMPLVFEGFEESAVLNLGKNLDGNATGNINATKG